MNTKSKRNNLCIVVNAAFDDNIFVNAAFDDNSNSDVPVF